LKRFENLTYSVSTGTQPSPVRARPGGIVAKPRNGLYGHEQTRVGEIKNPNYMQAERRVELFEELRG